MRTRCLHDLRDCCRHQDLSPHLPEVVSKVLLCRTTRQPTLSGDTETVEANLPVWNVVWSEALFAVGLAEE